MKYFYLLAVLTVFSLALSLANTQQVSVIFDQVYTNSAHYRIQVSESSGETPTNCGFFNPNGSSQPLECRDQSYSCSCDSGTIINLTANTNYQLTFSYDGQTSPANLTTASTGNLTWTADLDSIIYNITYSSNDIKPFSCSASASPLRSATMVKESREECTSGVISGLNANTSYTLTIVNDDAVIHSTPVITSFYTISVTYTGLNTIEFVSLSNLVFKNPETNCIVAYTTNSTQATCLGGNLCNRCDRGNITQLLTNTEYSFSVYYKNKILSEFTVITGNNANMTYQPFFSGLNYSVNYPDNSLNMPSHCYPCIYDLYGPPVTMNDCLNNITMFSVDPAHCTQFKYSMLKRGSTFGTILFDPFGTIIGSVPSAYCPKSDIIHTSYELTSISYELDTELFYNKFRPCQIYNEYGDQRQCLVNGVATYDCKCQSGKLINLQVNSYIWVEVIQDGVILALDRYMYTADNGHLLYNYVGIYSFEYLVKYSYNTHPPYQCHTCVIPTTSPNADCTQAESVYGRGICRTYRFTGIKNQTEYRLKIYDGDNVLHTTHIIDTAQFPINSSFDFFDQVGYIQYKLEFSDYYYAPITCLFYFEEDPSFIASCYDSFCMCEFGKVAIPVDKNYRTLVVTDGDGIILGRVASQQVDGSGLALSTGGIVGIVLFVIILAVIVATVTSLIIIRKRDSTLYGQNYEAAQI